MSNVRQLVDSIVQDINDWHKNLSISNNNYMSDGSYEWSYVRMAVLIPLAEYNHQLEAKYDWYEGCDYIDEHPDMTHILLVAMEDYLDGEIDYFGYEYPVKVVDGVAYLLEDADEITGRGPSLQDATYNEAIEWMSYHRNVSDIHVYDSIAYSTLAFRG